MEEEEDDGLMLSSLGVTAASAEDIERTILSEAKNDAEVKSLPGESSWEQVLDAEQGIETSSTSRAKLYNKLRALDVEINAVAASIEPDRRDKRSENDNDSSHTIINRKEGDVENGEEPVQVTPNGLTLREALASDRLKSLKKKKAELRKELSKFGEDKSLEDFGHDKLLSNLVRENPKRKLKSKEGQDPGKDLKKKRKTVTYSDDVDFDAVLDAASSGLVETERDELVRKGILTPFHKLEGFERRVQQPGPSNRQFLTEHNDSSASITRAARSISEIAKARPTTKLVDAKVLPKLEGPTFSFQRLKTPLKTSRLLDSKEEDKKTRKLRKRHRPLPDKKWREAIRETRLLKEDGEDLTEDSTISDNDEGNQEIELSGEEDVPSVVLEGGLKIPETIFEKLFDYQKVGVQWLWELHCQRAGGIMGDEMGLGKTVQVVSFLGALHFSKMYKPSIVVCPVTLLRQWEREANKWYPSFHVEILHDSAHGPSYRQKNTKSEESDYESEGSLDGEDERILPVKSKKRWDDLVDRVLSSESGLLITTYEQLRILGEKLLDTEWGYAILDEGHRIRNPNADVTLVCKQLQTVHRIIMTGAPIQNKLSELWSLFDFVFPGKLGVLPVFEREFGVPITIGGYANATPLQVSTAYRCAVVLRDLIMPYLLRRMKADVNAQLPNKTEHVLFCSLTMEQRTVYRAFLASSEVEQIIGGSRNSLYGIDVMRKVCNHPDLLEREHSSTHPDYGNPERSGKMKVAAQVLKAWKDQGHRVLLFTQTQQMLDIIESFLIASGYTYRRMDGITPVKQRMALIDEFNNSSHVFVFILTTKVGGLGTNLVGANRVIIYDPDWNPSTDMQARERAWRIGQKRDVMIYRLITRGTIEEKVYHRQIYKHFLTNKILKNPQQKRFFKARDLRDLFTLQDDTLDSSTETSNIFSQLSEDVNLSLCENNQGKQESLSKASIPDKKSDCPRLKDASSSRRGKEKADENDSAVNEETQLLKNLFDAHGLSSAINHDAILNANDDIKIRYEEQASQVARRAAEALRQSRMLRSHDSISVPTWTGKSGAAGAPPSLRKKFGSSVNTQLVGSARAPDGSSSIAAGASMGKALSSGELLAKIRGTQEMAAKDAMEHQLEITQSSNKRTQGSSKSTSKSKVVQPEVLIRQMCTFLQQRGGTADVAIIGQHFQDSISYEDRYLFKSLLKEIAVSDKDASGSRWVLKPEYRQ
ncbi:Chromatin structure-remodeling complex protein SYD [Acorus gramineus]|uniref:Chromatin structure-remodeling complex protein SYD n=1 Tax=Acorus gramineus TaxID=55184 RepID=A0AAV9ASG8_ACOGR|nr:Chromatin structure-remodeling complex protein SYD [Acorus gramineus]